MSGEANAAALRRLIEEGFGRGDLHVVDDVVDPECVEHQPGLEPPGSEGVKNAIRYLHRAFPDFHVMVQHAVADGDLAWIHFTAQGTHLGPLGRVPPTGKSFTIDVIDICRFEGGRIVEHWGVPDRFSQAQQLELMPAPRQPG